MGRSGCIQGHYLRPRVPCPKKEEDVLLAYTKQYDFPIIKCNDFGHKIANCVIPVGVDTKIDIENKKIEFVGEFLQ